MCARCPEKTPLATLPLTISVSVMHSQVACAQEFCTAMMLGRCARQALYIIYESYDLELATAGVDS